MYNTTIINLHLYLSSTSPFKITVFRKFLNASSSVKFSGKLPIEIRLLSSNENSYDDDADEKISLCMYL
jgi:hypothetical protein